MDAGAWNWVRSTQPPTKTAYAGDSGLAAHGVKPGHLASDGTRHTPDESRVWDDRVWSRTPQWQSLPRLVSFPWENGQPRGLPQRTPPRPRSALPQGDTPVTLRLQSGGTVPTSRSWGECKLGLDR